MCHFRHACKHPMQGSLLLRVDGMLPRVWSRLKVKLSTAMRERELLRTTIGGLAFRPMQRHTLVRFRCWRQDGRERLYMGGFARLEGDLVQLIL